MRLLNGCLRCVIPFLQFLMSFVPIETNSFLTWTSGCCWMKVSMSFWHLRPPVAMFLTSCLPFPRSPASRRAAKESPATSTTVFLLLTGESLWCSILKRGASSGEGTCTIFLNDMLQHSLTSFGASVWCPFTTPCLIMAWDPGFITFIVLCSLGSSRSARLSGLPLAWTLPSRTTLSHLVAPKDTVAIELCWLMRFSWSLCIPR